MEIFDLSANITTSPRPNVGILMRNSKEVAAYCIKSTNHIHKYTVDLFVRNSIWLAIYKYGSKRRDGLVSSKETYSDINHENYLQYTKSEYFVSLSVLLKNESTD